MAFNYCRNMLLRIGLNVVKEKVPVNGSIHSELKRLDLLKPFRGCRGGVKNQRSVQRPILPLISERLNVNSNVVRQDGGVNASNLTSIKPSNTRPKLQCAVLNARSVNNKTTLLNEYVKDNDLDIFGITETWLKAKNQHSIAQLTPPGYTLHHVDQPRGNGGGVAIMHKDSIRSTSTESKSYQSFDYIEKKLTLGSLALLFTVIYRTPTNNPVSLFIEDFASYLESLLISKSRILVCGDFNIHVDKPNDPDTIRFNELLESTGLKQHVTGMTSRQGHLIDLVLTRDTESQLSSVCVRNDRVQTNSDHSTIFFELDAIKPPLPKKIIHYRKLKSINIDAFKLDIVQSGLPSFQDRNLDTVISKYNSTLSSILDKHAPLKKCIIHVHPDAPWIDETIKEQKRTKRHAEMKMKETGLTVHHEIYKSERNKLNHMIERGKKEYYQKQISESSSQQSTLFKCADQLLNKRKVDALPTHDDPDELCDRFLSFFHEKIRMIHEGLQSVQDPSFIPIPESFDGELFTDFRPVSEEDVAKIIKSSPSKSCSLDPIPTQLLKQCLDILIPIITRIVNQSFEQGYVPHAFKLAAVIPLLKKADLIAEILKNFRPISNLPYLSKVLEKVATKQFIHHKEAHKLREPRQSAYRANFSTETALLRINHDLLMSKDKKECTLMCLLDLSAAFDTVSHDVLLRRLADRYGIAGTAHAWITSYLHERRQFVTIGGHKSREMVKDCDVPQGSVLGPNLYEDYTAPPVGQIFRKHNIEFMIYADDTQAYLSSDPNSIQDSIKRLELCLEELRQWMANNWLKLNDSKTEFIVFCNEKAHSNVSDVSIQLGDAVIHQEKSVRSIGAHLDSGLTMQKQISAICKAAWYYLYQIGKISSYLSKGQVKTLVHAQVTSRLDCNNSLLIGLPKKDTKRLQTVQNAAARLIMGIKKRDHVTPALMELHWLPVEQRVVFKVLLLVYKALHDQGPDYLKELLQTYTPSRTLRSSSDNLLVVPPCRYADTRKRAFGIRGPQEWNSLPKDIREKTTVEAFKRAIKTHLFRVAFY